MSNASVHAFLVGRLLAESIGSVVEKTVTNALSDLGKFDAEQREMLRQLATDILDRAAAAEAAMSQSGAVSVHTGAGGEDLQELIDNLRAETAQLRTELQQYRSQ